MKRIISILAAAVMLLTLIPSSAFAAHYESGQDWNGSYAYNQWNDNDCLESEINLAVGGTYDIPYYDENGNYVRYEDYSASGNVSVDLTYGTITGVYAGTTYVSLIDDEGLTHSIKVNVVERNIDTETKIFYVAPKEYGWYEKSVSVSVPGIDENSQIEGLNCNVASIDFENGKLKFILKYSGTTNFNVNIEGKEYTFSFKLVPIKLNKTSFVCYKGKTTTLKVTNSAVADDIKWSSTNTKVAKVGSSGKVTAKGIGRCYIKATYNGSTVGKCLVECTYKKAYKAVQNAKKDMNSGKIKYSQANRMGKYYRDCSSFTSRCYWDPSLSRKLVHMGSGSWALTAAGQAKWLNDHGKKVAKSDPTDDKIPSLSKLLPGDLVFFRTNYAGLNGEWRHIDHAAIYIGDGKMIDTVTSLGSGVGKGDLDVRYYMNDYRVSFIGRPCK